MCGIAGWWGVSGSASGARLAAMLDAMAHRGPDGRDATAYPGGAAGMVRLALVDLSPRGQQPLWSPGGDVAILFNGEMYDFQEHRRRLEAAGHRFASATDTEVVLALYLEHGERFVDHIRGMYALAIIDRRGRPDAAPTLLLARDPFGVKPLYIAPLAHGGVAFASELRAIWASGLVERRLSASGVDGFLRRGFVVQPGTIAEGVEMLPAGTWRRWEAGEPARGRRFWSLPPPQPAAESFEAAAARQRGVLEESVALHAFADAPVGAFLSGGVDSAAIVALMRPRAARLRTYSLAILDVPDVDEADEAAATARAFGCEHTTVGIDGPEVAELLPRFALDLDQPSIDGLNTWLVSRAAARDVKGVLSGIGGDEWFAGYAVTRRMAQRSGTLLGAGLGVAGRVARGLQPHLGDGAAAQHVRRLAARSSALALWSQVHSVFTPEEGAALTGRAAPVEDSDLVAILDGDAWREESAVGLSCVLDVQVYMRSQLLRDADAASMAHSLELRVPFVDPAVAGVSRACADLYKLHPGGGEGSRYTDSGAKRVLLAALAGLLPEEVATRPKRGFALPTATWMRGPLAPLFDDLLSAESAARRGLLDPALVAGSWRRFHEDGSRWVRPWCLGMLELWCREVLDGGGG